MASYFNGSRLMSKYLTLASLFLIACGGSDKKASSPVVDDSVGSVERREDSGRRRSHVPGDDDEEDYDDNLEIEGLKGYIDPYDIQRGVEPRSADLAQCFEKKARRQKFLGGKVELSYTVARDGTVKTVRLSKSDVGSWDVEKCLLSVSRKMKFKKPKGGEADFSLPLEFEPSRGAMWWSEMKAEEELSVLPAQLEECGEQAASDPRNVWVTLYLGNRGVIKSVGFGSPHKDGIAEDWADCAVATVMAWTLNDPRGKVAKLSFRYNPE